MSASIGRAFSIFSRLGVPQLRRATPTGSSNVGRTLYPVIQEANGSVVYESNERVAPVLVGEANGPTLPASVDMLTTNNISVPPSLLLGALPWQSLLEQPPQRVVSGAPGGSVASEIERLHAELQQWSASNHMVGPQLALDICKRFSSWMALRDIEQVLQPKQEGALDAVRRVLASDLDVDKFAARHEQIRKLLSEDHVHDAYVRAQAALRALESAHRLIDSARLRVMEAQRRVSTIQWRTWAAAGACIVLGVACDYLAAVPAVNLPIIESVVQNAALTGAVLCISAATALYLSSEQFASYLTQVRDAHDAHLRVRLKLEEDINLCLDQGYHPNSA